MYLLLQDILIPVECVLLAMQVKHSGKLYSVPITNLFISCAPRIYGLVTP